MEGEGDGSVPPLGEAGKLVGRGGVLQPQELSRRPSGAHPQGGKARGVPDGLGLLPHRRKVHSKWYLDISEGRKLRETRCRPTGPRCGDPQDRGLGVVLGRPAEHLYRGRAHRPYRSSCLYREASLWVHRLREAHTVFRVRYEPLPQGEVPVRPHRGGRILRSQSPQVRLLLQV